MLVCGIFLLGESGDGGSEGARLEPESGILGQAEHEVHVLYSLSHSTLQQVVDAAHHEQLVLVAFHIHHSLVGVDYLFHVGRSAHHMGECRIAVILLIYIPHLLDGRGAMSVRGHEDASGKAAALGDEEHASIVAWSELLDSLVDLQQVLVCEGLVDGYVVVAPREVGGGTGLLSGSRAACDAVGVYVTADDAGLQRGQQPQLDAGGKASGIGQMLA